MINNVKLGGYLNFIRREQKFSLFALAKKVGYSKSSLSRIENGQTKISDEDFKFIVKCLNIEFDNDLKIVYKVEQLFESILFKSFMFDYTWKDDFDYLIRLEPKIIKTTAYPLYILIRYYIYSIQNSEIVFRKKYGLILEKTLYSLTLKQQQAFYTAQLMEICDHPHYQKAIDISEIIFKQYPSSFFNAMAHQLIVAINQYFGNVVDMQIHLDQAIELCKQYNNIKRVISLNIDQANIYGLCDMYDEALKCGFENLERNRQNRIEGADEIICNNIGVQYLRKEEYAVAIEYYKDAKKTLPNAYFSSAHCYYRIGDYKNCRLDIQEGLSKIKPKTLYYDMLKWLESTLNKKYSNKSLEILLKCYEQYYEKSHYQARELLLKLLIEHYEYKNDLVKVEQLTQQLKKLKEPNKKNREMIQKMKKV